MHLASMICINTLIYKDYIDLKCKVWCTKTKVYNRLHNLQYAKQKAPHGSAGLFVWGTRRSREQWLLLVHDALVRAGDTPVPIGTAAGLNERNHLAFATR